MRTSDPGMFRLRQALSDLNRQRLNFPLATVRRIGAGLSRRGSRAPDLQQRLEWHFSGKVPLSELGRDPLVQGALLMASALPEDDFDSFVAATVLLLVERLSVGGRRDEGFWNWRRLAPHYRLAAPDLRAAIMCGFREARRAGLVALPDGPEPGDCLTLPHDAVLELLGQNRVACPIAAAVETAIRSEADAVESGRLWLGSQATVARLPDSPRRAALAGFRLLYERPLSMEMPGGADAPPIPAPD